MMDCHSKHVAEDWLLGCRGEDTAGQLLKSSCKMWDCDDIWDTLAGLGNMLYAVCMC